MAEPYARLAERWQKRVTFYEPAGLTVFGLVNRFSLAFCLSS